MRDIDRARNGEHLCMADGFVVEIRCAALSDQLSGNVERQEILELDVGGSVDGARVKKVNGADSPQAESKNHGLGAKASRIQPRHSGGKPVQRYRARRAGHGAGSAFLSASSSVWATREALGVVTIRQPSS